MDAVAALPPGGGLIGRRLRRAGGVARHLPSPPSRRETAAGACSPTAQARAGARAT